MVNYVDIENTLNYLDSTYLASMSDPLLPILYSKIYPQGSKKGKIA